MIEEADETDDTDEPKGSPTTVHIPGLPREEFATPCPSGLVTPSPSDVESFHTALSRSRLEDGQFDMGKLAGGQVEQHPSTWKADGRCQVDGFEGCTIAELDVEEELVNEHEVFRTLDSNRSWHTVTSLADVGLSIGALDAIAGQQDAQNAADDSDCMFRTLDSLADAGLSREELEDAVKCATPGSVRSGVLHSDITKAAGSTLAAAACPSPKKRMPGQSFERPEGVATGTVEPRDLFREVPAAQADAQVEAPALGRQPQRRARQNKNRISQYRWLEGLFGEIAAREARPRQGPSAVPLFVMAGACPNFACGMQAVCYFACEDGSVDFWWVKPRKADPQQLERETLSLQRKGPHKNGMGGSARALHAPLSELFSGQGTSKGGFNFGIDATSGRAFIEDEAASARGDGKMLLYLVWQESWSSAVSRGHKFIAGKLCYQRSSKGSIGLYARQYRISDGEVVIAPWEEEVATILPPESLQEMHDMD